MANREAKRERRLLRREQALALKTYDPVKAVQEKIDREAEERARKQRKFIPLHDWELRGFITPEQAAAGYFYQAAQLDSRSTVVSTALLERSHGGERLPPQEVAMRALERLRLCEDAVPAEIRTTMLDPIVVGNVSATTVAERLERASGRKVRCDLVTRQVHAALDLLVEAKRAWEAREARPRSYAHFRNGPSGVKPLE